MKSLPLPFSLFSRRFENPPKASISPKNLLPTHGFIPGEQRSQKFPPSVTLPQENELDDPPPRAVSRLFVSCLFMKSVTSSGLLTCWICHSPGIGCAGIHGNRVLYCRSLSSPVQCPSDAHHHPVAAPPSETCETLFQRDLLRLWASN